MYRGTGLSIDAGFVMVYTTSVQIILSHTALDYGGGPQRPAVGRRSGRIITLF